MQELGLIENRAKRAQVHRALHPPRNTEMLPLFCIASIIMCVEWQGGFDISSMWQEPTPFMASLPGQHLQALQHWGINRRGPT